MNHSGMETLMQINKREDPYVLRKNHSGMETVLMISFFFL